MFFKPISVPSEHGLIAADQPQAGGQACLPARAAGCIRWL